MPRFSPLLLSVAVPAIALAGIVLVLGIASRPPAFVARAAFTVNWDTLPLPPGDKNAQEVKKLGRQAVADSFAALPRSEKSMDALLDSADFDGTPAQRAAAISRVRKRLRLWVEKDSDNRDRFLIEVRHNSSTNALELVDLVLKFETNEVQQQLTTGSGLAAARSYCDIQGARQRKQDLSREMATLRGQSSPKAQERLHSLEGQYQQQEVDHAAAGFMFLAGLSSLFGDDAIKLVEPPHVEKRGAGHLVGLVALAAGSGAAAGLAGFFLLNLLSTRNKPQPQPPLPLGQQTS